MTGCGRKMRWLAPALLSLGAVLCIAPRVVAQTHKGSVQQNESGSSGGDVFNSQAPATVNHDEFNSNSGHGPTPCERDESGPQPYTKLWGQPDHVTPAEAAGPNRERWIRCALDPCHPGYVQCWRNPNYKQPVRDRYGHYAIPATGNYTPPYVPPIPGGVNVCNDPNAWRIPQCQQQTAVQKNEPYDVRADVPAAAPQMRYTIGFERGFAGCLESQATLRNAAIAAAAARFRTVAAILLVVATPGVIDGVLHPPGTSTNPNPYLNGVEQGSRLCTWALKVSPVLIARPGAAGIGAAGAAQAKPPSFEELLANFTWLKHINPQGCKNNCALATIRVVDALLGKGVSPASTTKRGMTDAQMERAFGGKFTGPMTSRQIYELIESTPEGTVGVVSAENPNYSGQPAPPGGATDWNQIPGHFFAGVKTHEPVFLDGQAGGETPALPLDWHYRWLEVGNGTAPSVVRASLPLPMAPLDESRRRK